MVNVYAKTVYIFNYLSNNNYYEGQQVLHPHKEVN
jgi:hypothetical protein